MSQHEKGGEHERMESGELFRQVIGCALEARRLPVPGLLECAPSASPGRRAGWDGAITAAARSAAAICLVEHFTGSG